MSALETPKAPEPLKVPDTVDEIVEKYLSNQDYGDHHEKLARSANAFLHSNVRKYAGAIQELGKREGMQEVINLADTMVRAVREDAIRLKIPHQRFSTDKTWAIWDIGKQYYFSKHPDESGEDYKDSLADPMGHGQHADEKKLEIVHRRLGFEGYKAYSQNLGKWKEYVDSHEDDYAQAVELLQTDPKPDGQLHSYQFAKLGAQLHRIAANLQQQKEMEDEHRVASAAAPPAEEAPDALEHEEASDGTEVTSEERLARARRILALRRAVALAHERSPNSEASRNPQAAAPSASTEASRKSGRSWPTFFKDMGKGYLAAKTLIPGALGGLAAWEGGKVFWEAIKAMFGVLKKLGSSGFSFKALNKSVDDH